MVFERIDLMSGLKSEYLKIKESFGMRPSRTQMYGKLGEGFRKYLKDGWMAFLASMGDLNQQETAWSGTEVEEFLVELENTAFQKSYKIPTVLAFLNGHEVRHSVHLLEIAGRMMDFYNNDEILQNDFCDESNRDWRSWDRYAFARLALENPVYYLAKKERFFHYDEIRQVFSLDECLCPYLSSVLAAHIRDIMEFRRLRYIRMRYGNQFYVMAETAASQAAESPKVISYNKLVRDKIPEIIEAQGKHCEIRRLDDGEYKLELDRKLHEELEEYLASGSVEELADLMEVVLTIVKAKGLTVKEFEKMRIEKKEERGGFEERVLLVKVE